MFVYAISIPTRKVEGEGCDDDDNASDDVGGGAMSGKDGVATIEMMRTTGRYNTLLPSCTSTSAASYLAF